MSWISGPFVAYDLETTAPDPNEARIVTVAYVDLTPRDPEGPATAPAYAVDRWSQLVDPGIDIPEGATEVHGITTEHARANGSQPAEVINDLHDLIAAAWGRGVPVVGHNVVYDLTVLDREMRRHLGRPLHVTGPVIDTLCLDKALDKYRKGKRTLAAACEHYDVRLDGAHDATEDALAAARVLWRLARRYPQLAAMTLDELQGYQTSKYAEQASGLEAYFKKKARGEGKDQTEIDAIVCERDWPMRPYLDEAAAA